MGDFSAFAKFGVTLLCVHFWSRRLRQNIGRCLHFTRILIRGSWICAGVFFNPLLTAYFFGDFPLVPPMQNLRKWAILALLQNLA